jgi:PmbA protein
MPSARCWIAIPPSAPFPTTAWPSADSERLYLNSEGACRHQHLTTASIYLYARAEEMGRKPRSAGAVRLAYGAG